MFGKDTQHCDENGLVTELRHETVIQVALGKAHAVSFNMAMFLALELTTKGNVAEISAPRKKVYYTGKGTTLGYKVPSPHTSRWTLMKETLFNKNEVHMLKKCKVMQVALGHEGLHVVLVLDNGTTLFTGIASCKLLALEFKTKGNMAENSGTRKKLYYTGKGTMQRLH